VVELGRDGEVAVLLRQGLDAILDEPVDPPGPCWMTMTAGMARPRLGMPTYRRIGEHIDVDLIPLRPCRASSDERP